MVPTLMVAMRSVPMRWVTAGTEARSARPPAQEREDGSEKEPTMRASRHHQIRVARERSHMLASGGVGRQCHDERRVDAVARGDWSIHHEGVHDVERNRRDVEGND